MNPWYVDFGSVSFCGLGLAKNAPSVGRQQKVSQRDVGTWMWDGVGMKEDMDLGGGRAAKFRI